MSILNKEVFSGVIIAESLSKTDVLQRLKIFSTKVSIVTPEHKTPWLTQWTLHTVEISGDSVSVVAKELSESFDMSHPGSWYIDFKSDICHYIVYPHKVFQINRQIRSEYEEATRYGISIGIPAHQLDFAPHGPKENS